MCSPVCLTGVLALVLSSASAFSPLTRQPSRSSWKPAEQTQIVDGPNRMDQSPVPTGLPDRHELGEMELVKRFSLGTDTCGFISGYSSAPVTCVKQSAYCTNDGVGNMDCCTGDYSACTSSMFSACLDFSASSAGACSSKGPRTICCPSVSPSCYTLIFSTTASPGKIFSILECQAYGGLDTLLATPPSLTTTTSSSSTISSSSSTSTTATTSASSGGGGDSTPVGPIVGGVVGGVAVLALIAFGIIWILLRHRKKPGGSAAAVSQPAVAQATASHPMSPSQHAPQQFDPQQHQAGYYPSQSPSNYKPDYFGGAAPTPEQQRSYSQHGSMYMQGGPSPISPGQMPPGQQPPVSTSPGTHGQQMPYQQGHLQQSPGQISPQGQHTPGANELPTTHALGTEGHRAEMG